MVVLAKDEKKAEAISCGNYYCGPTLLDLHRYSLDCLLMEERKDGSGKCNKKTKSNKQTYHLDDSFLAPLVLSRGSKVSFVLSWTEKNQSDDTWIWHALIDSFSLQYV